jgi:polyprenyl-phospho-N-acetylgalactosaminyl synthase
MSADGSELSASCVMSPEQPFFAGHFPGAPIVPAVVQLQLVEMLLQSCPGWPARVTGGSAIKFSRRVLPGSELRIRLARSAPGTIKFTLEQEAGVVARGTLQTAGTVSAGDVCGLIPVYNNRMTLEGVVSGVLRHLDRVIIVDDGSDDGSGALAERMAADRPGCIHVQHHARNRGKGAAVQTGLRLAQSLGCSHALQIDADGQHDLEDIPHFIEAMQAAPDSLILGAPVFGDDIPALRKYGRQLTRLVVAIEAGSLKMPDAMCGFRLYPVAPVCRLGRLASRMCFDPEVMIRAYWAGIPIATLPTRVRYLTAEEGGVSHFRMVHDNVLNVWMHTRLLVQAPLRWLLRRTNSRPS